MLFRSGFNGTIRFRPAHSAGSPRPAPKQPALKQPTAKRSDLRRNICGGSEAPTYGHGNPHPTPAEKTAFTTHTQDLSAPALVCNLLRREENPYAMNNFSSLIENSKRAVRYWWLLLIIGIALFVVGILIFVYPTQSYQIGRASCRERV